MKVVLLTGGAERHHRFAAAVPHVKHILLSDTGLAAKFYGDGPVLSMVRPHRPDVIFVYGTGKLGPELVHAAPFVLNFHGGDPERYRGLDSHLWALYHKDFDALQVTLHHVDDGLDTGDIVFQTQLSVGSVADLQAQTELACVQLAHLALHGIEAGFLPRRKQRTKGRYYSRMPQELRGLFAP